NTQRNVVQARQQTTHQTPRNHRRERNEDRQVLRDVRQTRHKDDRRAAGLAFGETTVSAIQ
ncbi:MAG: hypothetical protein ABFS22_07160, partial [Pseudomonadota bacterium]